MALICVTSHARSFLAPFSAVIGVHFRKGTRLVQRGEGLVSPPGKGLQIHTFFSQPSPSPFTRTLTMTRLRRLASPVLLLPLILGSLATVFASEFVIPSLGGVCVLTCSLEGRLPTHLHHMNKLKRSTIH